MIESIKKFIDKESEYSNIVYKFDDDSSYILFGLILFFCMFIFILIKSMELL